MGYFRPQDIIGYMNYLHGGKHVLVPLLDGIASPRTASRKSRTNGQRMLLVERPFSLHHSL